MLRINLLSYSHYFLVQEYLLVYLGFIFIGFF